jgi:endoglucanase
MNEPYNMATENWVSAANEAIRRIRATGATNTIAVPGNGYSGAHSWAANWYGTPNAQVMLQVVDSGRNMVFEAHQYLDSDSSGTSATCTSATIGSQRLAAFTAWLRTNGKRGLLGEFAGANNDTCKQALANMLSYMETNNDVWAGWTYWAGGPWWGDSMFNVEPANGVDRPLMSVLQPYLD